MRILKKSIIIENRIGLGGLDPYSSSKACAELVTQSYRNSFFLDDSNNQIGLATARAGNVIGGGDWAKDRLVPDAMRAFSSGEPLQIRFPNATRPWQHVFDPLCGYLLLAEHLWAHPQEYSGSWNFGPETSRNSLGRKHFRFACQIFWLISLLVSN